MSHPALLILPLTEPLLVLAFARFRAILRRTARSAFGLAGGAAPALPYPLQRLWEKSRWVIGVVLGYIVVKLAWAGLTERPFLDLF